MLVHSECPVSVLKRAVREDRGAETKIRRRGQKKNGGRNLGRRGSEEKKEWGLGGRGRCRTWWQCKRDDLRLTLGTCPFVSPSLHWLKQHRDFSNTVPLWAVARAEDKQSTLVHVGPAGSCSCKQSPAASPSLASGYTRGYLQLIF